MTTKLLPVSSFMEMILAPVALANIKELASVKPLRVSESQSADWINVWKEINDLGGKVDDDNLEQASLSTGTRGIIIGVLKESPSTCRFFVQTGNKDVDGIYYVNMNQLNVLKTQEDLENSKK